MKRLLHIGLLTLSILFVSCSSDENEGGKENNSISATINGKLWNSTKILNVSLIKIASLQEQRFDISAQDDSQMIVMACASDFTTADAMPLKEYTFEEPNEDNQYVESDALFINSYLIDGNTFTEHMVTSGKIKITSMDASKKTVSGTFSFTTTKVGSLQTKIATPEIIEVKNGVFTNLKYTVYAN